MAGKVWFITGASRGFGRVWAEAALSRGDRVAATARDITSVADLKERFGDLAFPLALDVTDAAQAADAVNEAHRHFGRLDVVLNNAGYGLVGVIEEGEEANARALFDTNYFGPLRIIKAALPFLRAQGSGHIIGVSSQVGVIAPPMIGYYASSKWALEAVHESLAQEVRGFGIKVTLIEPGPYGTDFSSDRSIKLSPSLDVYADVHAAVEQRLAAVDKGDPKATAEAVLAVVDAAEPPLRLALGAGVVAIARAVYAERLATWAAWEDVSVAAHGGR